MNDDSDTSFSISINSDTITSLDTTYTLDLSNFQSTETGNVEGVTFHEYDNSWPSQYAIEEMIKKYPALKIQYEKFLEIYNLVKDDYKVDDDDFPF